MSVFAEFKQASVLEPMAIPSGLPSKLRGWLQRSKTHHYHASNVGLDYSLDTSADEFQEIQMTSQKAGVKKDDCITIHNASEYTTYKIVDIDFYSNVSDMWVAKLVVLTDQ